MAHQALTVASLLRAAEHTLAASSDSPRLDAELLLAQTLQRSRSYLYSWPEAKLNTTQQALFQALLQQRVKGEPIAYLIGRREFWSLELEVSPATLIPRPETELLVEQALLRLPAQPALIADLGTGSGAIALALAHERPDCRVIATDYSTEALALARRNAARLQVSTVEFCAGDWLAALPAGVYQMIVSNPPYIAASSSYLQHGDVRFEPTAALVSGADGLDAIRHIVTQAQQHLATGGWLLLEHGFDQGASVRALLSQAGYQTVSTEADLAGHERVSCGQRG